MLDAGKHPDVGKVNFVKDYHVVASVVELADLLGGIVRHAYAKEGVQGYTVFPVVLCKLVGGTDEEHLVTSALHRLARMGLTTTGELSPDHDTLVLLKVVAKLADIPLVGNGKRVDLEVLHFDVIQLGLPQVLKREDDASCFADSPGAKSLVEGKELTGFRLTVRWYGEAVCLDGRDLHVCLCECIISLHQLEVVALEQELLDVAEAVFELLLGFQDEDVVEIAFVCKLAVGNFGGSAKPIVQAIRALLQNGADVLNLLHTVDGATVLGLIELTFSIV